MRKQEITLQHAIRFHARPVAALVSVTEHFQSEMHICIGTSRISLKSIIGVMTLGLAKGDRVFLEADGPDEDAVIDYLVNFFEQEWPQMH